MKKLRRLLFRFFLFVLVILIGIICLNTLRFSSRQISSPAIELLPIGDGVLQRLSSAVQIPTVSYADRIDTTAFLQLREFFDSTYLRVNQELEHYAVNDFSRVYYWPGKNPKLKPILMMAHLDVVPVEKKTESEWEEAPFGGLIKGDFIWGRGTLDDKMNALGMLEAIDLLLQADYQPDRGLYLAFGHDEEVGGRNGAQAIARRFAQQGLTFEYILDEGMVIMEKALPGLEAPVTLIGTAEKGYATLDLSVELAEGGHSSMPPKETAIGILSKALYRLETEPFPARIDGPTAALFDYVGPEMNLPFKTLFANLWLFEGVLKGQLSAKTMTNATVRTTTAPTIVHAGIVDNVLPTKAEATVNFRILPGETVASVIEQVQSTISEERVEVKEAATSHNNDPSKVPPTDAFGFSVLQKTACEIFPHTIVAPALMIAATDSRHYQQFSENIYRFSPMQLKNTDLARIHGHNERISIENYQNLIRFYHQLILNSCN